MEKGKHVNGFPYQDAINEHKKYVGIILLVLPAASSPSMSILISLLPKILDSIFPISRALVGTWKPFWQGIHRVMHQKCKAT